MVEGGIHIDVLRFSVRCELQGRMGLSRAGARVPAHRLRGPHQHAGRWLPDETFSWNRTIGQRARSRRRPYRRPWSRPPRIRSRSRTRSRSRYRRPRPVDRRQGDLRYLAGHRPHAAGVAPDVLAQVVPVAIDSTIALHFKPSVDDKLIWGQITPPGMGCKRASTSRPCTSWWSSAFAAIHASNRARPADHAARSAHSRTDNPPFRLRSSRRSVCGWDADFQREQKLDPRHFLLNAEMPYLSSRRTSRTTRIRCSPPGWLCRPPRATRGADAPADLPRAPWHARSAHADVHAEHQHAPMGRHCTAGAAPSTQSGVQEAHLVMNLIPEGAFRGHRSTSRAASS